MQHLIIRGDPEIRRDAVIEYDGEELVCFSINVQGGWHGPDEPQLWCTVGSEDEREAYDKREYVPHWLDVDAVDAEEIEVLSEKGALSV
ncbi:HAH_0734 family protein [Halorubrum yunnanense]|uniref:HAH_0734 family protein n=1 Tax=Halorubrum yunnanense TaxID=1526162 RepID=A0ABD5YFH1_9EURY|nr:HAH_0734 family protein [Halorubrum yunnanense]